jgi:hypothetical protein
VSASRYFRAAFAVTIVVATACTEPEPLDRSALSFAEAVAKEISEDRLMATVGELARSHLEDAPWPCSGADKADAPRFCHLTNDRTRALVTEKLRGLDHEVTLLEASAPRFPTTNVLADIKGARRPDEIVLVGAHYDAFYAGADDNSSGLAVVLELARLLRDRPIARTVRFVAFDLEEVGLVGSTRYIEARGGRVKAAVILDCVGYYDERPDSQKSLPGLPAPTRGNFLAVIANDRSSPQAIDIARLNDAFDFLPIVSIISPGRGDFPGTGALLRSDHAPFWLHGASAIFLTDTADFRNPHYHQKSDTVETLHPRLFTKAARLAAAAVAYWATEP